MLSTGDLYKEIGLMEDVLKKEKLSDTELLKAILKSLVLSLKLVHNIRTNSVLVMEKMGVEKVKTKQPLNEETKSEKKG